MPGGIASRRQGQHNNNSSYNSRQTNCLVTLAVISVLFNLMSIFGPTLYFVDKYEASTPSLILKQHEIVQEFKRKQQQKEDADAKEVQVQDLKHEALFRATVRSCLPQENRKCKIFIPDPKDVAAATVGVMDDDDRVKDAEEGDGSTTEKQDGADNKIDMQQKRPFRRMQRVVLISPPGDIASSLLNRIELVVYQHNRRKRKLLRQKENSQEQQIDDDNDLEIRLIQSTHVPPYGYGKTHGYSKIIRLVPQPLLLQVADALQALLEPGEDLAQTISIEAVKTGLRQILRFHCRLSHVAAHTSLLSVNFLDLLEDAGNVTKSVHLFLAPKDFAVQPLPEAGPKQVKGARAEQEGEDDLAGEFVADDDEEGIFDAQEAYGTQLLTIVQGALSAAGNPQNIHEILNEVLLDEMQRSKNMTAWPCLPFWAAGDPTQDPLQMSPINQRLAEALSPNCNDPLASCWVERDKCEAAKDGACSAANKRFRLR